MTFNDNYILRNIAGEALLVRQGADGVDLTRVVALNASGAFLYNSFKNKTFTTTDLADALVDEFGIDADTAAKDAAEWIKKLSLCDAISL